MKSQAISLRVAPDSGADGLWSSPLSARLTGGAVRHLAIPWRAALSSEGEAHLHGPRVHRALQQPLGYPSNSNTVTLLELRPTMLLCHRVSCKMCPKSELKCKRLKGDLRTDAANVSSLVCRHTCIRRIRIVLQAGP